MKVFICQICGHIVFNGLTEDCPVCGAKKEDFIQNDNVFVESQAKSPEAEVKHVPEVKINKECKLITEEGCTDILIRIGATLHPMLDNHYIQFIDCYCDDIFVERIELTPRGVFPAGCVHLKKNTGKITIVEKCNIHGYWKKEIEI